LLAALSRLFAQLWRRLPVPKKARTAIQKLVAHQVTSLIDKSPLPIARPEPIVPGALIVSGLFGRVGGVAAAAQRTVEGLTRAGRHPALHDIDAPGALPPRASGGVWIIHANPPELRLICWRLSHAEFRHRYLIGYWAWELPELSDSWIEAIQTFHELWAPSQFVAAALLSSPAPPPKVRVMPHPTRCVAGVAPDRGRFNLNEGAFAILVSFDLKSTLARKNPAAALRAYVEAFSPTDNAVLFVKILSSEYSIAMLHDIADPYKHRSDIRFITETLSDGEMLALIATVDVVLSLHRSEGYGMVLAEAMALGVCVVATGWSGNMDFMDEQSAMLVPYTLVPAVDPQGQYCVPGSLWAEPDVHAAAQALRRLYADPALRKRIGAAAKVRIKAHEKLFFDQLTSAEWSRHIDAA
jgi:glycosyltransferase involved in cell wall biosynthesis